MPELPEVETIVRGLRPILGKTIAGVKVRLPKMAVAPNGSHFTTSLRGERITKLSRRGKYTVIGLRSGRLLVISLRMTGRLMLRKPADPPEPYTYVEFRFTDGRRLIFADVRQFGRVRLVDRDEPWAAKLGIEPLSRDFTPERFIGMLAGRTTPIKAFLLDQRRIAGVGNIYACEALWEARIRPGTPAQALSKPAARRLHRALVKVLGRAIELGGSSVDDYVDAQGRKGAFQDVLSVYGKAGSRCVRCGRPIIRTVLAQRGTWWCRGCQK